MKDMMTEMIEITGITEVTAIVQIAPLIIRIARPNITGAIKDVVV